MDLNRGIDTATLGAMSDGNFNPVLAVELDWPDDYVRVHSGAGSMTWGGETWEGIGHFGKVEVPTGGFGAVPGDALLSLTGVPPEIFDTLTDDIRNRYGAIYFGVVTEPAGSVLVGNLTMMFEGYMDTSRYIGSRESDVVTHGVQISLGAGAGMRTSANVTHSYEAQMAEFPGDTAGRHLQWATSTAQIRTWPE